MKNIIYETLNFIIENIDFCTKKKIITRINLDVSEENALSFLNGKTVYRFHKRDILSPVLNSLCECVDIEDAILTLSERPQEFLRYNIVYEKKTMWFTIWEDKNGKS